MTTTVTSKNLTAALKRAGKRGLFIGFTASTCTYCSVHEAEWNAYADAQSGTLTLPQMVRVDADRDRSLLHRHEVEEIPAVVLAWRNRWIPYAGIHSRAAMTAFGAAQLSAPAQHLSNESELHKLLESQRAEAEAVGAGAAPVLLIAFISNPDDDEVEEFVQAAEQLRRLRTDVPVRAAYVQATRALTTTYARELRWFDRAPSAILLVGGDARPGCFHLDEAEESGERPDACPLASGFQPAV